MTYGTLKYDTFHMASNGSGALSDSHVYRDLWSGAPYTCDY